MPDPSPAAPPSSPPPRSLVVKITCGPESTSELERLAQGLTVATTALAGGIRVSVWLTGEATRMATPGYAERLTLAHAASFADLRDVLLAAEALTVCSQCAARRELTAESLLTGARIRGAMSFVEEVMDDGAQALVY